MSWFPYHFQGVVESELQRRMIQQGMERVSPQQYQPTDANMSQGQTLRHLTFQFDGRGFAKGLQITAGETFTFSGNVFCPLKCEIEITEWPPPAQVITYYSLLTDGEIPIRGTTLGKTRLSIQRDELLKGKVHYATEIDAHKSELDAARLMRIWLDCEPSMDWRMPTPRLPALSWGG